jgi:5-methylcytosine-specific restriction endonuclease McrA
MPREADREGAGGEIMNCDFCGKEFVSPKKVGSPVRHCSDKCRHESRLIVQRKYTQKHKLKEYKELRVCPICGDSFIAEGKGFGKRYCSDKCAARAENNNRNEQRLNKRPISVCPQCKNTFKNRGGRTYCSYKCYIESKRPPDQTSVCPICGKEFNQRGNKLKYCSSLCSIEAQAEVYKRNTLTRRALRVVNGNLEKINPKDIFERDGWRCQICGKKVLKGLYKIKGTKRYHNAPSIDHIIPISRGGQHTKSNVQCACYLCNCKKGNRVSDGGDQLLLFG